LRLINPLHNSNLGQENEESNGNLRKISRKNRHEQSSPITGGKPAKPDPGNIAAGALAYAENPIDA
jgi:hypothetical protein